MNYSMIGKKPVSEGNPEGSDVRYDDVFELLQSEIDKLVSPAGREEFSWETVLELSKDILMTRSKDILVASYLTVAMINLEGGGGLLPATVIYRDILETFWETLFPPKKRFRGRISALEWWVEKIGLAINNGIAQDVKADESGPVLENLKWIDQFVLEKTEVDISLFTLIQELERNFNGNRNEPETSENLKPPVSPSPESEPSGTAVSVPTVVAGIGDMVVSDGNDIEKKLTPLFQNIRMVASLMRENKKQNPQAYRWLRFSLWESVKTLPFSTDGITKISPPGSQTLAHLKTLMADEDWETLLQSSESALYSERNMFLLDLNYYSAKAMMNLGKSYNRAREIVCHETELFIRRLPGIELLSFSDGTPFASSETQSWIYGLMHNDDTSDSGSADSEKTASETVVSDALQHAKQLMNEQGTVDVAVSYLQEMIQHCQVGKDKILLKLGLSKLLIDTGNQKTALSILDGIYDTLVKHDIGHWDPGVALACYRSVYTVFRKQSDVYFRQRAEQVFRSLANISPSDSMRL